MILRILGALFGFFMMVVSLFSLVVPEEPHALFPDEPAEIIPGTEDPAESFPGTIWEALGNDLVTFAEEYEQSRPADTIPETVTGVLGGISSIAPADILSSLTAGIEAADLANAAPELTAGIGADEVADAAPELTAGIGADEIADTVQRQVAGIGADIPADNENIIYFDNVHSIEIPEGLILENEEEETGYRVKGYGNDDGPAFILRCLWLPGPINFEDLQDVCDEQYGGSVLVEKDSVSYLTAYDQENETDLCFMIGEKAPDQLYIIGMTGLNEAQPAQWYFQTMR